ncbi:Vms1/Ankzf1 family peptidyl-tRNA hydrolase [Halorussus aquaticus]|uniref:Vms1/Ankzf1 family peptidyl-tRNA hydrolase n=1 Tax=Halorussus aquaticus TaxID=2953748 RepID=A0ABD5Q4Z7_9EURY|nr:Vms1/Ankzf1 family peptidyl-tRNA hydrolase [Halorussus aquaticus]
MLDELLGRAALKDRIADLEDEKRHLERQLEAEEERRAEAATARQEAEQRVNQLEDRVTELEDRVERTESGDGGADLDFRGVGGPRRSAAESASPGVETVRGDRLAEVLSRLESVETDSEGALTAMVEGDGDLPEEVETAFGDHAALVGRAAPCLAVTDDAGLVSAALAPPVAPDPFAEWSDGFRLDREWFLPTGTFALALVRSDLFALGTYEGRERRDFEGFESDVKSDHSKGGFSQGRFERRRDAQIDEHLDECEAAIEAVLADSAADRLYVVGQRTLLGEFEERADATRAVDATGDPRDALDDAFREFWTTRLHRI